MSNYTSLHQCRYFLDNINWFIYMHMYWNYEGLIFNHLRLIYFFGRLVLCHVYVWFGYIKIRQDQKNKFFRHLWNVISGPVVICGSLYNCNEDLINTFRCIWRGYMVLTFHMCVDNSLIGFDRFKEKIRLKWRTWIEQECWIDSFFVNFDESH